jgi:quinol monooxygenase YgiN
VQPLYLVAVIKPKIEIRDDVRARMNAHMLTSHVIAFIEEGDSLVREPTELRFYDPA